LNTRISTAAAAADAHHTVCKLHDAAAFLTFFALLIDMLRLTAFHVTSERFCRFCFSDNVMIWT
jgi:hypothetical protein